MTPGIKNILLATIFFTLMNVGVKYLSHIPSYEVVLFRAFVSLVVCFFLLRRQKIHLWGNNKKNLLLRGISGTAALVMYFYTLQNMPLASAVTIQHLSPIFTIIIATFMLKETARPIQWLFFIIAFGGVFMVKGFDARITVVELCIGISAAFLAGLAYNYVRKLKDTDHYLVVVFYFPLVTVPVVGTYTLFNWVVPSASDLVVLLFIGLTTTAAQIYMTKAYHAEKAANITIFNYLGVVYAIFIGLLFFNESLVFLGITGIILIIFSLFLSSLYSKK